MEYIKEEEPSEVITPDTENATWFNPNESNNSDLFEVLRFYNRGTWKDRREENKELRHRQDNLAIFDALAGQLSLTSYQKQEGRRTFGELELGELGHATRLIAFGVCVVVANDDVHGGHRFYPTAKGTDEEFRSMQRDLGFNSNTVLSVMGKIDARRS
jgi:hypothetical protein